MSETKNPALQEEEPTWSESLTQHLSELAPKDRNILKRSLSHTPGQHIPSFALIERWIPRNAPEWQRNRIYLAAALTSLTRHPTEPGISIGHATKRLKDIAPSNTSIDMRFHAVLQSDMTGDANTLRQLIMYFDKNAIRFDWERLLKDLLNWDDPNYNIQHRWALHYHRATKPTQNEKETTE